MIKLEVHSIMPGDPIKYQPIFVVTVDTEADDAWKSPEIINLRNMKQIPRFQKLCETYNIIPTYLVTYECATRDEAIRVLEPISKSSRAEIGHHLHVWSTPPFQSPSPGGVDMSWLHAFQFELPLSLLEDKAESLRAKIEDVYGRSPTSHRAGRWGIDQRSIDWLCNSGFTVDTSVRPLVSSPDIAMPACGFHNNENPYIWNASKESSNSQLWEIPTSIHRPSEFVASVYGKYVGSQSLWSNTLRRVYAKLGGLLPLRPDPKVSNHALLQIIDSALARKAKVINLTLHSSELELGCSPFSPDASQSQAVWERLETVFAHISARNVSTFALSDVPDLLTGQEVT